MSISKSNNNIMNKSILNMKSFCKKFNVRMFLKEYFRCGEQDVYLDLEKIYQENEQHYYRFCVLTKEIIEYDKHIFNNVSNEKNDLKEEFLEYISRPFFLYIIINKNLFNNGYEFQEGNLYESRIKRNVNNDESCGLFYINNPKYGDFCFVEIKKELSNSKTKEINDVYYNINLLNKHIVKDENKVIDIKCVPKKDLNIKVYNLGNANCNVFTSNGKPVIMYDIGYHMNVIPSKNSKLKYNINPIKYIHPKCVVISHWDTDHYILYNTVLSNSINIPWIVSSEGLLNVKNRRINLSRLLVFLSAITNLYILDSKYNYKITFSSISNKIIIGNGSGTDSKNKSVTNNNGIICYFNYDHCKALLSGDVSYGCLPNFISKSLDFIVVPHHGGEMNYLRIPKATANSSIAMISATGNYSSTKHNQNNRPNKIHSSELGIKGYKVHLTYNELKYNPCSNIQKGYRYSFNIKNGNWF